MGTISIARSLRPDGTTYDCLGDPRKTFPDDHFLLVRIARNNPDLEKLSKRRESHAKEMVGSGSGAELLLPMLSSPPPLLLLLLLLPAAGALRL